MDATYDPAGAEQIMTAGGWTRNVDGLWADPSGNVPTVRWIVDFGNARRTSAQSILIPAPPRGRLRRGHRQLRSAAVRVPAAAADARLRHGYVHRDTAAPDPHDLTSILSCEQIPTEANGYQGANKQGVCDEEASAKLDEATITLDEEARRR